MPKRFMWCLLFVAVVLVAAVPVYADVGPKPSVHFTFVYQVREVTIVQGKLMQCEDPTCTKAKELPRLGPQGFECSARDCEAVAYGFAPYQKLVIDFADRQRESNIFELRSFGGEFTVTVKESSLEVKQKLGLFSYLNPLVILILFPVAGLFTEVVELIVAAVYLTVRKTPKVVLVWVFLVNILTVPAVWFIFPVLGLAPLPTLVLAELFAVVFEVLFLYVTSRKVLPLRHAALLGLLMNLASFLGGLLLLWPSLPPLLG